jgi:hypothetical protein
MGSKESTMPVIDLDTEDRVMRRKSLTYGIAMLAGIATALIMALFG